jgi:hypothetical protein
MRLLSTRKLRARDDQAGYSSGCQILPQSFKYASNCVLSTSPEHAPPFFIALTLLMVGYRTVPKPLTLRHHSSSRSLHGRPGIPLFRNHFHIAYHFLRFQGRALKASVHFIRLPCQCSAVIFALALTVVLSAVLPCWEGERTRLNIF